MDKYREFAQNYWRGMILSNVVKDRLHKAIDILDHQSVFASEALHAHVNTLRTSLNIIDTKKKAQRIDQEEYRAKRHQVRLKILDALDILYAQSETSDTRYIPPNKRKALVIGCSEYIHAAKLRNTKNDAEDIANELVGLGFDVEIFEDLARRDLLVRMNEFGIGIKGYDVALFYYAGHGLQLNSTNYLVPVDADLKTEQHIEYDCVNTGRVLADMEAASTKVNIVILDACRDNPFESHWKRGLRQRGLALMDAPSGTIIAYATAPGSIASDGSGRNGLYTEALIKEMGIPDLTITSMFQNVRRRVLAKSDGKQEPWESTSLTNDFHFRTSI